MTALILFSSGLTKRNQASKDNVCNWTDQLVRSVRRALHRYRRGQEFKSRTGLNIFTTAQVVFSTAKISFIFTSLSAVQIYDCYIFTVVYSSLHGFIWNQHNGQLPVGLLAQLVGHCTGIAEVMGSNPVQAWIFFRPYFHYYSSNVHNCEDRFHIHEQVLLLTDKLWSIYTSYETVT